MKIYTKTGDNGETSLNGGKRVKKHSLRINAYGTVDELNAHIGKVRSLKPHKSVNLILEKIQHQLFVVGCDLSTQQEKEKNNDKNLRVTSEHITTLELWIDDVDAKLKPLHSFILPFGSTQSAELHIARTVCRRAERLVAELSEIENINPSILIYLNRLSDLLFVLSRYANLLDNIDDVIWQEL